MEQNNVVTEGAKNETEVSISQDGKEMEKLGKVQQFKRGFSFWSILGFSVITMVTWPGILVTMVYGLQNGGPAGLIIGFFFVWSGYALVVVSLGEMMSMYPTSGGQVASVAYLNGTVLQGLIVLNYPDYTFERWHGTLLIYALMLVALVANTLLSRWLPHLETLVLVLYFTGFIAVLVVVTALSPRKASNHDVWQVFINSGGWPTQGLSFCIGLQGIVFAWLGADGAIHMAEEIQSASTVLPWSLLVSVMINGVLGFAMLVTVLYCGGNLFHALASPTGYPIEQIFTFASQSVAGGTGLTSIIIGLGTCTLLTAMAAASREMWAFARDEGLLGSKLLKRIHAPSQLPLWTILVTFTVTILLAIINVGSSIALNAVISLTIAGYFGSYIIPLTLILYRRIQAMRGKGRELPYRPWSLGKWGGLFINVYALIWSIFIFFWSFWPPETPTTAAGMNWSVVAYGAVTIFVIAFWYANGRKRYYGPVRDAAGGVVEPTIHWDEVEK